MTGHRIDIPDDLVPSSTSEEYEFPDVRRRAYGAILVLVASGTVLVVSLVTGGPYSNGGSITAALVGMAFGAYALACSWRLQVTEKEAILRAGAALSFPIGPASISIGWRGLLSRPLWRVLAYSPEKPTPLRRGFVVLDAVSGEEIAKIDENNPEDETDDSPPEGE